MGARIGKEMLTFAVCTYTPQHEWILSVSLSFLFNFINMD